MSIWLIATIWMAVGAVFVLALCAAAAKPIPSAKTGSDKEQSSSRKTGMQTPDVNRPRFAPGHHGRRKRRTSFAIASLACLSVLSLVWAGCSTSRSYPGPVHGLTFNGTVQSADIQNHRLTVTPLKSGEPVVFLWDDNTKFWKTGIPISPEALERTWTVKIHYHESGGQLLAHHVYIQTQYPIVH